MNRWLLLAPLALALVACGNLSNEDLRFAAGTPHAQELAVHVAPATGSGQAAMHSAQALDYGAAEHYATAVGIADSINSGVSSTLDLVDALTHLQHPTERSDTRRVWGPYRNVDSKGITLRVEVDRETTAAGKVRYRFCLHLARDAAFTGDAPTSCDLAEGGGLERVLWGDHEPSREDGGLRSGKGTVHIEGRILKKLDPGADAGHLALEFEFSAGGEDKQLHVVHTTPATLDAPSRVTTYEYGKVADHIDFFFQFPKDFIGPGGLVTGPTLDETVTINAAWTLTGPGRSDGTITGGDLDPSENVTVTECWNAAHRRVYYHLDFPRHPILNKDVGSLADCPP